MCQSPYRQLHELKLNIEEKTLDTRVLAPQLLYLRFEQICFSYFHPLLSRPFSIFLIYSLLNPFMSNEISCTDQMDQFNSVLRGCWVVFSFDSKCDRLFYEQTVETLVRSRMMRRLIWVCTVCLWGHAGKASSIMNELNHPCHEVLLIFAMSRFLTCFECHKQIIQLGKECSNIIASKRSSLIKEYIFAFFRKLFINNQMGKCKFPFLKFITINNVIFFHNCHTNHFWFC